MGQTMQQFTKRAIMETFVTLLNKTPLDKITVKDIVEACGINRNTFYYYFQDIYSLLDEVFRLESEQVLDTETLYDSWEDNFLESIHFAIQNKKMIYHVYNSVGREHVENYLYQVTDRLMIGFVERQAEGLNVSPADQKFISDFYKYALVGMTMNWIGNGMEDDGAEMVERLKKCFDGNIRNALRHLDSFA